MTNEKAIKILSSYKNSYFGDALHGGVISVSEIIDLLSAQSEIIYCRNCEKYGTKFCAMDMWTDQLTIRRVKPNDFCSYAERREE